MFLLDTNTVSELMKRNSHTWKKLLTEERNHIFLCEAVIAELLFGLNLLKDDKRKNLLYHELTPLLDTIEILSWDRQTSRYFGEIKAGLMKKGKPIADLVIAIASCAFSHGCTLVTDNFSDFNRIEGLNLVNWKN